MVAKPLLLRFALSVCCVWVFATSGVAQVPQANSGPKLSDEGEARRAAHSYLLGEFAEGKILRFRGEEPHRILDEIVLSSERREVSGDVTIDLPPGAERVASMFRYIILRGEGLDHLGGLVMHPYAPKSHLPLSTRKDEIYRAKVAAMPIPSESMQPIQIRVQCQPGTKAVITEVAFNSQAKLSTIFDDIPYRNLGAEHPREKVQVNFDPQNELSIDGHVDLEREKFFRYYAAPGNLDQHFENWAAERNFQPGRQIMKFQPALVKGYSPNQPKLTDRADKPGAADLSFFDRYNSGRSRTIPKFRDIKFAMCFDEYPDFMSVEQVGRGTPLVEHFDDAAELAAAYVEDQIKDGGRSASYWEVKNEATIKAEWDYHYRPDVDAWALMADLHNRVAKAVHERSPETMVGGPTSAWMQVQVNDFDLYRNQLKFMDLTKDHVDFYSHHFYEDYGSLGAWERRDGKYTNYLLGRLEAILDMFRAHMHATDNVKPILITECGSLQPGRGPSDYWLRLRAYSAYMHKLSQRPEQIDLAVPFIFLSMPWNPKSGDVAFIPKDGKPNNATLADCDPTPMVHFFDLWRDFDGRRLPVAFDREFLDITAVHNGKRLQFAITNMGGRRLSLDINPLVGSLPIGSISQRRLYYRDGEIHYHDDVVLDDLSRVEVDVEESTVVTVNLTEPLEIEGSINRTTSYAPGTAIKSHEVPAEGYRINVANPDEIRRAVVNVGVFREGGLGGVLSGTINGHAIESEAKWANEFNHLFGTVSIEVPASHVREENTIKIEPRDGLTITSVNLVTDR